MPEQIKVWTEGGSCPADEFGCFSVWKPAWLLRSRSLGRTKTDRQNSNSNSKTLFYKDCGLGSVKSSQLDLAKLLMSECKSLQGILYIYMIQAWMSEWFFFYTWEFIRGASELPQKKNIACSQRQVHTCVHHSVIHHKHATWPANQAAEHLISSYDWYWRRNQKQPMLML